MKKLFIYSWLPMLFAAMATFSFTACGGSDGDDTDYAALAAMQGALGGGGITVTGEAIDLGLSVKWASCNVGATQPWEYGGYYAWGETEEKSDYSWITYKYCNGTSSSMTKYCTDSSCGTVDYKTTLEPGDDVATVKWGGNWRMPTAAEIDELTDNCTWQWTTLNDVNGWRVTGPNGNSIFLPAAGCRDGQEVYYQGSYGCYWSSSLFSSYSNYAYCLFFYYGYYDRYNSGRRCIGPTVRPVCP